MTGGVRLDIREDFGKPIADNVGHLGHEIRNFFPFVRQQVMFQLGMDCPLGINLCSFPTDKDAEQLDVPSRGVGSVFSRRISVRLS